MAGQNIIGLVHILTATALCYIGIVLILIMQNTIIGLIDNIRHGYMEKFLIGYGLNNINNAYRGRIKKIHTKIYVTDQ